MQAMRDAEHPLTDRDVEHEDMLDQVRGTFAMRRPPQEGQKPLPLQENGSSRSKRAVAAANPGEAVRQHAAAENLPELTDDERRPHNAVGALANRRTSRRRA